MRTGNSSNTTRWAMCADGRNAMVTSSGPTGSTAGPTSKLEATEPFNTRPIFGSPVAPDVR